MLELTVDEALEQLGRIFPRGPYLDRRLGRALAFQALYEMDLGHHAPTEVLERLAVAFGEATASPYPTEILQGATRYAQALVRGVLANRGAIDGLIQLRAPLWPLAQMSAVDRNVLRIGLYESLYSGATVPLRTAINEAVELAKLFGSETSAKFVNGVLGRAVEASANGQWRPAEPAPVVGSTDPVEQVTRIDERSDTPGADATALDSHPATTAG
ncbi:MAG: transcription antitermination factor NusB [Chloroflexi bacterium]|nr:transcription antitermination factor NusB [Chloroflexota bacterium]